MEKFDQSNLSVLSKLEKDVKLQDTLDTSLKLFFQWKETVVEASIVALLKLVICDKSANSFSLADKFDYVAEWEGKTKYISLYILW